MAVFIATIDTMKPTPTRTLIAGALAALAFIPLIAVPTADHSPQAFLLMLVTSKIVAFALLYAASRILNNKPLIK